MKTRTEWILAELRRLLREFHNMLAKHERIHCGCDCDCPACEGCIRRTEFTAPFDLCERIVHLGALFNDKDSKLCQLKYALTPHEMSNYLDAEERYRLGEFEERAA